MDFTLCYLCLLLRRGDLVVLKNRLTPVARTSMQSNEITKNTTSGTNTAFCSSEGTIETAAKIPVPEALHTSRSLCRFIVSIPFQFK